MTRTTPNSDIDNPSYDNNHGQEDRSSGAGWNPPCNTIIHEIGGRTPAEQERYDDYGKGWDNHKDQTD